MKSVSLPLPDPGSCLSRLVSRYQQVRKFSEQIAEPLNAEDCAIQSMPDVSPTRWHLAHTTWFFETFLLKPLVDYEVFDASFEYLFNSYYNSVGDQFPRSQRGLLSRPGLTETLVYRHHVDAAVERMLESTNLTSEQASILTTGLNHEQQHQELMLTDIKHVFSCHPLTPIYHPGQPDSHAAPEISWIPYDEQLVWMGNDSSEFVFDNERPRHRYFLDSYQIANRCVTNGEYLAFIQDRGYQRPEFWLSLGWDAVGKFGWNSPLYWTNDGGEWKQFTLSGVRPLNHSEPVCHVSYFEADAYARWAGHRLPLEHEWEHAVACEMEFSDDTSAASELSGHWADKLLHSGKTIHPQSCKGDAAESRLVNAFGNAWQWTSSPYSAYPGYQPAPGALGEYNGKFMCNQFVLRGGSCATPSDHLRLTYRNFFPPDTRWQFSSFRLAQ